MAKNLVAAGLADRLEIQVAYRIGLARPMSLLVETSRTEHVPHERIAGLVETDFDLRPAAIRANLDLHRPIYARTTAYGHFGRTDLDLPWERIDKAEALKAAR